MWSSFFFFLLSVWLSLKIQIILITGDVIPPATNKRTLDKNGQERNDLQLSSSSGGQDHGRQREEAKGEETYVEMNITTELRSQFNYNQATPV